jgi:hypothetical protein
MVAEDLSIGRSLLFPHNSYGTTTASWESSPRLSDVDVIYAYQTSLVTTTHWSTSLALRGTVRIRSLIVASTDSLFADRPYSVDSLGRKHENDYWYDGGYLIITLRLPSPERGLRRSSKHDSHGGHYHPATNGIRYVVTTVRRCWLLVGSGRALERNVDKREHHDHPFSVNDSIKDRVIRRSSSQIITRLTSNQRYYVKMIPYTTSDDVGIAFLIGGATTTFKKRCPLQRTP